MNFSSVEYITRMYRVCLEHHTKLLLHKNNHHDEEMKRETSICNCEKPEKFYTTVQTRSSDEQSTVFVMCMACQKRVKKI